ncbi:MAG: FKBP-type peptidyl-prolyl cis-trans isomerase [Bacteroidales bacterium]
MNSDKKQLILVIGLIILSACRTPVQERAEVVEDETEHAFIETNKYIRERHREHIMAFAGRVGWEMTETPTGLWYMIMEKGDGPAVQRGKVVVYAYETRLLNGKICYSATATEPKRIVAGKGNIEAGLEEGLLLLREGSKARFIVPPHLAHGNFGDMDQIPGSSVLLIEVHVIEVKR